METSNIDVSFVIDPTVIAAIATGLGQHAAAVGVEPRNSQPLFATIHDDNGQLIGGLIANTVWGWLHVKELWVADNARGLDIGTKLMNAAENEARNRGCHHSLLDTFDFQARPFYEKLGYVVFAELADFPQGHSRFYLRKNLLDDVTTTLTGEAHK